MNRLLDRLGIAPRSGPVGLRVLVLLSCLLVGVVFIRAALPKIADPAAFAEAVFNYRSAPDGVINLVALFLPWLELVCGLALILLPRYRTAAGWLVAGMLLLFIGLQAGVILRGIDISCGCFSVDAADESRVGWGNLLRNTGLLLATTLAAWTHARDPAITGRDGSARSASGA